MIKCQWCGKICSEEGAYTQALFPFMEENKEEEVGVCSECMSKVSVPETCKNVTVDLLRYPTEQDWIEIKRRALVTVGKDTFWAPTEEWKKKILRARHSPIRYGIVSFKINNLPYWVHAELARHHVGCEKYVKSQRNDRQKDYDRNAARQDAPVDMIYDFNLESIMTIANKRLCNQATPEARYVVKLMCHKLEEKCPEFEGLLVPYCKYWGRCQEMKPCGQTNS